MDEREARIERYGAAALTLLREIVFDLAHIDPSRAEELRAIVGRVERLVRVRA
jgi:hypothetical protein